MYYINLKNGSQHTIPADITYDKDATDQSNQNRVVSDRLAINYAISLFGRYQIVKITNKNTGGVILS